MNRQRHNLWSRSAILLAPCALLLGGCVAQHGEIEQSLARIDRIEASLARVDDLEVRVATVETKQQQAQQGIINIAMQDNGLGIGLCLVVVAVVWFAWKQWIARRYWKRASAETIDAIEQDRGMTHGVRQRLAKFHANETPFGRLVRCSTSGSKNCSSTPSG